MTIELVSNIEAYVNGSMTREQFSVWFYSVSRKASERYAGAELEWIYEVEGIFAEASSGGWSTQDLKEELMAFAVRGKQVPAMVSSLPSAGRPEQSR